MQKRIADIVTRFRAEGLPAVRAALKSVADAAKKAERDANRAHRDMGRDAGAAARQTRQAWGSAAKAIGSDLAAMSRASNRAMAGIARGAASAAAGITRSLGGAIGGAAKGLGGLAFNKYTALGGAAGYAGYGATAFTPLLTGSAALAGALGAAFFTLQDLEQVRRLATAGNMTSEMAAQWQVWGREVGRSTEEVTDTLVKVQESVFRSLDPEEKHIPRIWERLGISITDVNGDIRSASGLMQDLAKLSTGMSDAQRTYLSQYLFEDGGESLEFLRRIGEKGDLQGIFDGNMAAGLLPSQADIERIYQFQTRMQAFWLPFKAFMRDLTLAFLPFFEKVLGSLDAAFRDPGERARIVEEWFVKPFERGLALLNDLLRVFAGFDLVAMLDGSSSPTPIANAWVVDLKAVLVDIWDIATGLFALFRGIGRATIDLARMIDGLVLASTGFSVETWLKAAGPQDIEGFFRDLGDIAGRTFRGAFEAATLRTPLGQWLGGQFEGLKTLVASAVQPAADAIAYLGRAWADLGRETATDSGLTQATTTLGQLLILIREAVQYVAQLLPAIWQVFGEGLAGPEGFAWLDDLKSAFDYVLSVVQQIHAILWPLIEQLGPEGIAKVVVGKLALDLASKLANPVGLAAGLVASGAGIGGTLANLINPVEINGSAPIPFDPATVKNPAALAKGDAARAANDAAMEERRRQAREETWSGAGGGLMGMLDNGWQALKIAAGVVQASQVAIRRADNAEEFRARDEAAQMLRAEEARRVVDARAEQAAGAQGGEVTAPITGIVAVGAPLIVNLLDGRQLKGVMPADPATQLLRSRAATPGGR